MKFNLKNVFLSVGIFVFALGMFGLVGTSKAEANACTLSGADGTWNGVAGGVNNGSTNGTVTFVGCTGGLTPAVGDTLTITANRVLTLTGNATIAGLTVANPASSGATTLTINTGVTLTDSGNLDFTAATGTSNATIVIAGNGALNVTGNTTLAAPGSTGNEVISVTGTGTFSTVALTLTGNAAAAGKASVNMGAGTLTATGLVTLTGAADAAGIAELTSSTGTLNLGAGVTMNGTAANTQLNNGGTVNFTGTMTGAGVLSFSGTLNTTGTTALDSPGSIGVFNVVSGTTTIGAGAFDFVTTTVTGILDISGATAKHFTGNLTVNGTFTNSGNVAETLSGNLTNNGTFTAGSGVYTLDGGSKTITGTVSIPSLTISGTYQNNGVLTVATALAGAGTLTQGAAGILNIGGTSATFVLNASTVGNTVTYTSTGSQTIKVPTGAGAHYYNLTLSGSGGTKTINTTFTVDNNLEIDTGVLTDLSGTTNISTKYLLFASSRKAKGSWGFTGSGATNLVTTFITGGGSAGNTITAAYGAGNSETIMAPVSTTITCASTYTLVNGVCTATSTTTTAVTCTLPQVLNTTTNACATPVVEVANGCSGGNLFNTSTGAACVNNEKLEIPGCGNGTTGFSTATGVSCAGNHVTTTTTTYNFGTVTLKNGSKGEAVKELQRFLNAKLNLGLVIDGKLGPKTIAVIKTWQKDNGLVSDGLVGTKTKAMMNK